MTRKPNLMTRRSVVTGVLTAAGSGVFAASPEVTERPRPRPNLQKLAVAAAEPRTSRSEALVRAANLSGAVGFSVSDADTGEVLESRLGGTPLPPASTLKVVTALFAIDRLGGNHQFQTRVLATGPLV